MRPEGAFDAERASISAMRQRDREGPSSPAADSNTLGAVR
jgi:hypothetical protein